MTNEQKTAIVNLLTTTLFALLFLITLFQLQTVTEERDAALQKLEKYEMEKYEPPYDPERAKRIAWMENYLEEAARDD
jgi:hypothetical protein